jgi:hypothetical protein
VLTRRFVLVLVVVLALRDFRGSGKGKEPKI